MTVAVAAAPAAKSVMADGIYTLAGRAIRTLLVLALSVAVARGLGPHDRGLYALPTVVYTGFVVSLLAGIADAMSYFMLNREAGRGVIGVSLMTGAVFVTIAAGPVAAFAMLSHNAWAIVPSLLLLPLSVPMILVLGYSTGTKQIRWQTIYYVLFTLALLLGMLVTFTCFSRTAGAAVDTFLAVNALSAAACLLVVLKDARALPNRPVPFVTFMLFSLRVGMVNVVTLLNYRADLYVVALLATPTVLGQYAVAVGAAETLLVVTQIPAVVTSPHVGSMPAKDAATLTARCVRMTVVVALLVCGALSVLAPFVVRILYGNAYAALIPALQILLGAVAVLSLAKPVSNYFTLKIGKPEIGLLSAICAATLCILLSLWLVPRVGMVGAAIATTCAYFIGEGIRITFFVRSTKLALSALLIPTGRDLMSLAGIAKTLASDQATRLRTLRFEERSQTSSRHMMSPTSVRYVALFFVCFVSFSASAYRMHQALHDWTNDGSIYLEMVLRDRGVSESAAIENANRFMLTTTQGRAHPNLYSAHPPAFMPRQRALFRNRPLYPRLASILPLSAPTALKFVSAVAYALIPPLLFLMILTFAPPWIAAVVALGIIATPAVYEHAGLALTDELALLFWIACVGAILAYLRAPSIRLFLALAITLAALVFTRPALALPLGISIAILLSRVRVVGRRAAWVVFSTSLVIALIFFAYTKAVHGGDLGSELQSNYQWQRSIYGSFTSHGFLAWRAMTAAHGFAVFPKTVLKNLGVFTIVLSGIGFVLYRRSLLAPVSVGALCATLFLVAATSPLDIERTVTLPMLPIFLMLAGGALGAFVSKVRITASLPPEG
jgi:O-antigen/teichoic acid export membrane protein